MGLGGVGFSDLYVLGGQLSRRVLGKSGFSFWAGTLFYVGILSAHERFKSLVQQKILHEFVSSGLICPP